MCHVRRASVVFVTLLLLVTPTVQLMSPPSTALAHQVSGKVLGKDGSRVAGMTVDAGGVDRTLTMVDRVVVVELHEMAPGFSPSPFVPPRV
jgi:hypothetical protein